LTYFQRLLALSGWRESQDRMRVAIAKTLLVWAVDFALFATAWLLNCGLSEANLLGFAAGGALNAWLKTAQLPSETRRSAPFLSRLLFVSLLSLFLRSGILGTCARAFAWPALVAIVPAIVTGWIVLFLGYALFIWPVREQYGSGVRWRVAAMGATAYLLALRLACLYTLPIDRGLAALPGDAPDLPAGYRITMGLRHLGTMLLGPDRAGLNLPALLCWLAGAWAVFNCAKRVFDKTTAFRALLLFSVLPVFFWTGSVFSPATVLITTWALLLWLLTFALRGRPGERVIAGIVALCFWWKFWWLPGIPETTVFTMALRPLYFLGMQPLLVTPVSLIAAGRSFSAQSQMGEERIMREIAVYCAATAGILALLEFVGGRTGLATSGAIWLPLLPFIASEMQKPGKPPAHWWGPVIYGCVLCYGLYFYWLAFSG
jgi:hypothetical protein